MHPDLASRDDTLPGYGFEEISDGQRILIALLALLHFTVDRDTLIALDDLVSFVALAEVQPFIISLVDRAEELGAQVVLISHHPEVLDYLAPDRVIRFDREPNGPVRVLGSIDDRGSGLRTSELVARGWEDE